ncbi:MAG TPA: TonB-dependent receptor [Polyangiaceae bacterium]|nr:TonB-dependent receptor [Polyangiaceae bacterium]
MRLPTFRTWLLAFAASSLATVYAPAVVAESAPVADAVTPPRLASAPPVALPPGAAPKEPVTVELELTIDASGRVSAARVVRSAGSDFDDSALAAARAFVFEPARRGDEPLAVTIAYRYVFPAVPAPAPSAAPPAVPAPNASAPNAPPPSTTPAPAKPVPSGELESFEATAEVEAPPREPTKRTLEGEELTTIPGTRGDALRAIEVLPGVARTGIGDGTPILRGAGSDESQTYLDGIPVPFLYHFGGVTSFFNSRLLSRVDLYPGNFSSRFGRVVGGVIDVRARDPKSDRFHGSFDLNLIDTSLELETPIGENTGIALAGRRSNIDLVYSSLVPKDTFSVVAAPVYYDYQGILSHRFGPHHRLRVLAYGSHDELKLVFNHPNAQDPGLTGNVQGATGFHRIQAELHSDFSPAVTQELTVALGRLDSSQHFGELQQVFGGEELYGRGEWTVEVDPALRVIGGLDLFANFLSGDYRGPVPTQQEGNPRQGDALAAERVLSAKDNHLNVVRPGAYVEVGYRPLQPLLLSPGVRADYYAEFSAWSIDPRLSARYELSDSTLLKAGVGRYSQPPLFWMSVPGIANPNLDPYHAIQVSAGFEQRVSKGVKFGVEGFYKHLDHVVDGTADGGPPNFVNGGSGRIYGAELSAEARPDDKTFGFLAYTLSRSERSDHGGPYRLFDHDQIHILSLAASRKLGKGWELGARFRLVSGDPQTPVTGSVFDARSGVYVPTYGPVNSERNPLFQELDVRVEKAFRFGAFTLATYLDVQNVYDAKNPVGYTYNYDYTKREEASGLPLFPNLGIRGEL